MTTKNWTHHTWSLMWEMKYERISVLFRLEACRNSAWLADTLVVAWPWHRAFTPLCIWGWHGPMAWPRHHVPLMSGFPMLQSGEGCRYWPANERRVLSLLANEEEAFGRSISLTVHSGRSPTSYFKACRTLPCSAHMISSLFNLYVYITAEPRLKSPALDC